MNALTFKQLSLAYRQHIIFRGLTANIRSGEFIAVLGANGAGKSSLLRAILGLLPIDQGQLLLFDLPVKKGCARIGYMPQVRNTFNVALSAQTWLAATSYGFRWGLPWITRAQRQELNEVVHLVQAEKLMQRSFVSLSGGERQRLLLAQALLNKPKLLLLDEPLSNLDPYYQESLVALIEKIRKQLQITVLFTSHDINPLLPYIDRVLYLAKGKAVIGSVQEVINSETLSALYEKEMHVMRFEQQLFVINKDTGLHHHVSHCRPDLD